MTTGEHIRLARVAAGYSQRKLAKALGLTQACISRWEHNISLPSLSNMQLLVTTLKLGWPDLIESMSVTELTSIALGEHPESHDTVTVPRELWEDVLGQVKSLQQSRNNLKLTVKTRPVKIKRLYRVIRQDLITDQERAMLNTFRQLRNPVREQVITIARALLHNADNVDYTGGD